MTKRKLFEKYNNADIIVPPFKLYEYKDKDVFVVNTTQDVQQSSSVVHLNIMVEGQERLIKVEPSWVPQHLNASVPSSSVLKSASFVNGLQKGVITLIKADIARDILNTPDAQEELQRIMGTQIYRVNVPQEEAVNQDELVTPRVLSLFDEADPVEEAEQYAALRTTTLTDHDKQFIMRQDNVSERIKSLVNNS